MGERQRSRWTVGVGAAAILLAPAAVGMYVAAYYCMVKPAGFGNIHGPVTDILPTYPSEPEETPFGPTDGYILHPFWEPFFAPIHRLDRRVRPDVWSVD